jgi:signal transduction histidine kinase
LHIKVTDEITENVVLSPTVTTHLFRIIQEAIQNCVKHAQATELNILFQSKMGIIIRIEDNGIGYATNKQDDHYGIQNMRHRATEMGFSFEIGKSAQGTLIILKEAD